MSATDYVLAMIATVLVSPVPLTMIGTIMTFNRSIINNRVCSIHGIVNFGVRGNNGGGLKEEAKKK